MGYQAVLFCPDEKLARIISQVFSEVDFVVDLATEPFSAVKKLMSQRYDAIVVDCDNEQNSSLLFKSARNSSFNQSSLAIALVEGQAGVAKAYRIGANLVLTKPINIEQAKGTLRVARGLLRKSADSAAAASSIAHGAPAEEAPAPTTASVEPAAHQTVDVAPPVHAGAPEFATSLSANSSYSLALPAMTSSARTEEEPSAVPAAQTEAPVVSQPAAGNVPAASTEIAGEEKTELPKPAAAFVPVLKATSSPHSAAAAAPAPAKEAVKPAQKTTTAQKQGLDERDLSEAGSRPNDFSSSTKVPDLPSFAAFAKKDAEQSAGSKRLLIAPAVVLALLAAGYFGWSRFGGSHPSVATRPATVAMQQQPESEPAPPAPSVSVPPSSPAGKVSRDNASLPAPVSQTDSSRAQASPHASSESSPVSSESQAKKPEVAPIIVRPSAPVAKVQPQVEEAIAPPPGPLAVESPAGNNLSGLMGSQPNVPKPTLAQIKVSQGVSQGLLIKRVQPQYPPSARASHAQGAVQIEATIDKEGNVVNPRVLSGNSVLAAAALAAVRQWRYKPYYLDGEPVEIETQITINFKSN